MLEESARWQRKDLLGIAGLSAGEIWQVLHTAAACKEIYDRPLKKLPTLRGKTVINCFYEPSTRTRTSFELAGKWMSADVINISASASSVVKGESLADTARTLESLGADLVVLRHPRAGAPALVADRIGAGVINAGDGYHEHPTQALLDLMTIWERKGQIEGLRVGIVGDIKHSRVARSQIIGLRTLGAQVRVCAPPTLLPVGIEEMGVEVVHHMEEILEWTEVLSLLRIQHERQDKGLLSTLREYSRLYGVGVGRLEIACKDLLLLHPGPANLGVEVSLEASLHPKSAIREQVTNGVAVRMALLYLMMGGAGDGVAR